MISAKPVVVVAMLALAGVAVAQRKTDGQRIAELIEQLHDADKLKRDTAMHQLADQGRPAALMLKNMLEANKPIDIALLRPLGRMGPDAVDCLPLLFDAFEKEKDPTILTAICHAILGVVPFMVMDDRQLHDGQALVRRAQQTLVGQVDVERVELARVLMFGTQGSYLVWHLQTDVAKLTLQLYTLGPGQHHTFAQAAVRWLGRAGSAGAPALGVLRAGLLQQPHGPIGHGLIVPFAEAILLIDPSSTQAIDAHAFLVEHGDAYQQQISVVALRHFGERAHPGTLSLARVAEDPDTVKQIRYEAITTLGILGPAAKAAIHTLEKLTQHADPQIAERAKAALRQIRDT